MIFELTGSLTDKILFAMEDQKQLSALNAVDLSIVDGEEADEENIYMLPFWGGENGFKVLEDFTFSLHNKKVHDELKVILSEGRGVFRNFKNKLKDYPVIEHSFYKFKENAMKKVIQEWYNSLREGWGLEKLSSDMSEIEEYDDLVLEDFIFSGYNHLRDYDCIVKSAGEEAVKIREELPEQFAIKACSIWNRQFEFNDSDGVDGFVCHTLSNEFSGCVLYSQCQSPSIRTAELRVLLVDEKYRGLGIAKTLMKKCVSGLCQQGYEWLLIATNFIPQMIEPLFDKIGFQKIGNVYAADLTKL